jgi:hypothetical protein
LLPLRHNANRDAVAAALRGDIGTIEESLPILDFLQEVADGEDAVLARLAMDVQDLVVEHIVTGEPYLGFIFTMPDLAPDEDTSAVVK